jgi:glycosyltransferase involved in cell wall biosynthesis
VKKFLWSIDAHVKGEYPFLLEFNRGKYDLLLHSTKDFVDQNFKIWFPNAYDNELIDKRSIDKRCDVGFCGSLLNRSDLLEKLKLKYNFIHDNFVIGDDMVNAVNSYKIHWNKNLSNDINYRSFETIGCGIPLLTNYNYQYELLGFKHMENVLFYNNNEEMFSNINLLLSNEELRNNIGNNGYLLSKEHTYLERCKQIINIFSEI